MSLTADYYGTHRSIVDRLTHKAFLKNMNGKSFRVKETRYMMEK